TLDSKDVSALYAAYNRLKGTGTDLTVNFNNNRNIIYDSFVYTNGEDYDEMVQTKEEVYEESINGMAFVVTDGITNYIPDDYETNYLRLSDSISYNDIILYNAGAEFNTTNRILTLTVGEDDDYAIYHLTDGGSSGLGIPGNESYTFFGSLLPGEYDEEDRCVIKVNGIEKEFPLLEGAFTYTFDNAHNVLNSIDIYFKYKNPLSFKADQFGFNIGRYKGNNKTGYPENSLAMKHAFHHQESVIVYYEGLYANEWELNGEEIVIIDSGLYKIGIENNTYYAVLKTRSRDIRLEAEQSITKGLHQYALVFDFSSLTFKFYIDSRLEASYDGPVFTMPDIIGKFPEIPNILIGGSLDNTIKCQGMIDEFVVLSSVIGEKELQDSFYRKSRIISVHGGPVFDSGAIDFTLENLTEKEINLCYSFDDQTEGTSLTIPGTGEGINNTEFIHGDFALGEHTLIMDCDTGSFIKREVFHFVVSYAPVVTLAEHTSILIRDENNNLELKLDRDVNTLFAERNEFIGLNLYLKGDTLDGIDENRVQVITEDRLYSNFGAYYRDKDYSTLSEEIAFIYPLDEFSLNDKIYYKISAYYLDNPDTVFNITGSMKMLDLTDPVIEHDSITGRPLMVVTGIKDFDPAHDVMSDLRCEYDIEYLDNENQEYCIVSQDILPFNDRGLVRIDVYRFSTPGNYRVTFRALDINGNIGSTKSVDYYLDAGDISLTGPVSAAGKVYIRDFDLIFVDKKTNTARFSLYGGVDGLPENEKYQAAVYINDELHTTISDITTETFDYVVKKEGIVIGTDYHLKAVLEYNDVQVTKELFYQYYGRDADVKITHGPIGYISYNNVYCNWETYLDEELDSSLGSRYSLDNSPWGEPSATDGVTEHHVEFYNLDDGIHKFKVQSYYGEDANRVYSPVASNLFIIDTKPPVIDEPGIEVIEIYDNDGIISHLQITGKPGTVRDLTLASFYINREPVTVNRDGSFYLDHFVLASDGINRITMCAYDILGNKTEVYRDYSFEVIKINYPPTIRDINNPLESEFAKYSPLTMYGRITDKILLNNDVKIYAVDPYGTRNAVINFDRTFFIENIKINPGSKFIGVKTNLKLVTEFPNGKKLIKDYPVYAKDVIKPIELDLSIHAISGGADTTTIELNGRTGIENVSCWSFDYDGDGVYEDEHFTTSREITVYHSYSDVGIIQPRVRIITADNHIFSGQDTLIIHDKVIRADIKKIDGVKALDILEIDSENEMKIDGFEFLYVLQMENNKYVIKRYKIEANGAVLPQTASLSIVLNELNINSPRSIKVDAHGDIYVSSLYGGGSRLYRLIESTGGYINDTDFNVTLEHNIIASFDCDGQSIYLSLESSPDLLKYSRAGVLIKRSIPDMDTIIRDCQSDCGVEIDHDRVWLGDYKNQRVVCISGDTFKLRDFFGEPGNGEGEFISPKIVRVKKNHIFVLDQSEYTLQVFEKIDGNYRIICRIDHINDYLIEGFMTHVSDFATFTKFEDAREYLYLALVNNEYHEVALLRIPQWETNSIRVRSNLVVYTRNNEIFTSKPDGSDARKVFSSGSLPTMSGKVDYPSIGPDGTTLAFVSQIEKYEYSEDLSDYVHRKYDKLYVIRLDTPGYSLVDDEVIRGMEIERPQFSFNGSHIVFSAKAPGGYWGIYEYDIENDKVTGLYTPEKDCMRPVYSPDDRYIAYVTRYYSHNEIAIYDRENPALIIDLTKNDYPDDYPVWAPVFEGETDNEDITSKIAFISKPDYKEKIFYTYIARVTSGDFRIVKANGDDIGDQPDNGRNEFENIDYDALGSISYPCFTANGRSVIFESGKDGVVKLMEYNMETKTLGETGIPEGATKPGGMKNRIVRFNANMIDGNNMKLTWKRYAKEDLEYTVAYKSSQSDAQWVEKTYTSQDNALIEDLTMGLTYHVRVYVKDRYRGGEVTTSILKKVVVPPVIAKPTIEIDENNPYLVRLRAWKPETDTPWEYAWKFKWFIDNHQLDNNFSDVAEYDFAAAGKKRIGLEVCLESNAAKMHRSEDHIIEITGDLEPVIDYELREEEGSLALRLDASGSKGSKIDRNTYAWKLSGSNSNTNLPPETFEGETVVRNLDAYKGNIYITLTVMGTSVMGQVETIPERKSTTIMIPLGLREIKPVITENCDPGDPNLFTFDARQSLGNIDWIGSEWEVFGPENLYFRSQSQSSFSYRFPEKNDDTSYTVIFHGRNKATGATTSTSKMITVGKVPVVPVIDYKVITASDAGGIVTAKLLLSAASSKGNDIDWNTVAWNLPLAGDYGSSSTQTGATAVYNLYNITDRMTIDVHLTIRRRNSGDIMEASEMIVLTNNMVPEIEPYIEVIKEGKHDLYATPEGDVYVFSALNSKGANIDWTNAAWLIDGQYTRQGSVVRFDAAASGVNAQAIVVTLTLRSTGGGEPVSKTMSFNPERKEIDIVISKRTGSAYVEADKLNMVRLSVTDSIGQNIDWERTQWFIYQGPEDIVEKYGADIVHAFPLSSTPVEYYPVNVRMFFKGSTLPFVKQTNVRVKGDTLKAVIKEETGRGIGDQYLRTFTAADSMGENIDWQNCKWSFGDSSEYQYGPVVSHRFPINNKDASYLVTLTIQRHTKAGQSEISTDTYTVKIGEDELNAKITVTREGNYVLFSAEESEGRGLMLDRSVWLFEGSDNENSGNSETDIQHIKKAISNSSHTFSNSLNSIVGLLTGPIGGAITELISNTNYQIQFGSQDTYLQDSQLNQSSGESSQNIYSGAACRKLIDGSWSSKMITLIVYRALPDGTLESQTKTFKYVPGSNDNMT
ncbi:MAG: hypothetical protein JXJ04_05180, partial [Spirochaetales bacterium]|nr:hypothetical protein [Spirochaetales bacterium]